MCDIDKFWNIYYLFQQYTEFTLNPTALAVNIKPCAWHDIQVLLCNNSDRVEVYLSAKTSPGRKSRLCNHSDGKTT